MKNKVLRFRVSSLEHQIIQKKITKTGLSMSEFFRRLSLELDLKTTLTEDEIEGSKYADNFRRISNLFKLGDVTGMKNEMLETSRIIKSHLEKFK